MTSLSHPGILSTTPARTGDAERRRGRWVMVVRWGLLDLAFWSAVTFLFAGQYWLLSGLYGARAPFGATFADQIQMWAPCAVLAPAVAWLAIRARFVGGGRWRAAAVHGLVALTFAALGGTAMGVLAWLMPGAESPAPLAATIWRGIVGGFMGYLLVYGLIVAAVQAVAYGRESRERQLAAARLQSQLADARVHALTTQLQPHFLFNTLNAVSALVRSDPAQAERTIGRLSDLLRYALTSVEESCTTLRDEVRFLEKYVEIQKARFGDRLRVTLEVHPDSEEAVVPRLLLQPLVENAIRHGISPRAAPGHVAVRIWRDDARLRLVVHDDGVGLPNPGAVREGVGLTATRARLRQAYPAEHEFTLSPAHDGGVVASIAIPFRTTAASAL